MVKGLYTAYTGMVNEQKRLDILANNLANADTNGYKKELEVNGVGYRVAMEGKTLVLTIGFSGFIFVRPAPPL